MFANSCRIEKYTNTFYYTLVLSFNYCTLVLSLDPVGTPLSLSARPLSDSVLLITWLSPDKIEINGKLTNFTLLYSSTKKNGPKNFEKIIPATDGLNNFFFILQGLTYGGPDYVIRVAANNEAGIGPFSSVNAQTFYSGRFIENMHLNTK